MSNPVPEELKGYVRKRANDDAIAMSLLYDLNILPECIYTNGDRPDEWRMAFLICKHLEVAYESGKSSKAP